MFICTNNFDKNTILLKTFLYICIHFVFNFCIHNFCSNSDEEYYDEECINLFLKILKKCEKNPKRNFVKLGTFKFSPETSFGLESFISQNTRNFSEWGFFIFRAQKVTS